MKLKLPIFIFSLCISSQSYAQNLCEKIPAGEFQCTTNLLSSNHNYEQAKIKINRDFNSIDMLFSQKKEATGDSVTDFFNSLETEGPSFFIPERGKATTSYKLISSGIIDDWGGNDSGTFEKYSKTICNSNKIIVFTKKIYGSGKSKRSKDFVIKMNKQGQLIINESPGLFSERPNGIFSRYEAICTLNINL